MFTCLIVGNEESSIVNPSGIDPGFGFKIGQYRMRVSKEGDVHVTDG